MIEGKEKTSVLFVCMGNICRSPTAEGVFRKLADDAGIGDRLLIDSAGTHAYHAGSPPDHRAREAAARRGYSLDNMTARRVTAEDFSRFDLIVAMDEDNVSHLREFAGSGQERKIRLLLEFANSTELREVPDPYYGGSTGFEKVLDLVENAARGLLKSIRSER